MPNDSTQRTSWPQSHKAGAVPRFPTRQYAYAPRGAVADVAEGVSATPDDFKPAAGAVYRFFLGRDAAPVLLSATEVAAQLHDPFAQIFLQRGRSPQSLREVLAGLDAENASPNGLPNQKIFLVADGGQIPWTQETAALPRQLRLAVARMRTGDADLLISTAAPYDSGEVFLQLLAWDDVNQAFQFYQRMHGSWVWAGSSWQALEEDTRGRGPFDSHVNGGLVMKELKAPWPNWSSISAKISPDVLEPNDPQRADPLFLAVESADQLELLVRGGLSRWTNARFNRCLTGSRLSRAREFLRQILQTTSINLTSAREASRAIATDDDLHLPFTFFLNFTAFRDVFGLAPVFHAPRVAGQFYLDCLTRYNVAVGADDFRFPGDTHFAFLAPEPAAEDLVVLDGLVSRNLLPPKLGAALLMVDFPNPVFSERRAKLLAYMPEEFGAADIASIVVGAVQAAAPSLPAAAPEHEFLALWNTPNDSWQSEYTARLQKYLDAVAARLATEAGFDDFFRLGESRRREFRRRPLAEFALTTPSTNIPEGAPLLEMAEDATVRPKT